MRQATDLTTFAGMEQSILEMYQRSRQRPLSPEEASWLKGLVALHPYFALPYQMLARYHQELETAMAGEALHKAAGMSPSRALLKQYLLETTTLRSVAAQEQQTSPMPAVEITPAAEETVQEQAEPVLETPKVEQPELVQTPILEDAPPALEPVVEVKAHSPKVESAPDINWGLHTRISIRTYQYTKLSGKILLQIRDHELARRTSEIDTVPAAESPELETPKVEEPEQLPSIQEVALTLAVEQDSMMVENEEAEVAEQIHALESQENLVAIITAEEQEIEALPAAEEEPLQVNESQVVEEPVAELKAETTPEMASSSPLEVIEQEEDELPPLDEEESALIRPLEFTSRGLGLSRKYTSFASESDEPLDESLLTAEYKIGAFSSFTFLEADTQEQMSTSTAPATRQVSLGQPQEGKGAEIVVKENGRIVEIQVTEEQLALLFDPERQQTLQPEAQTPEESETEPENESLGKAKKPADEIIERFIEAEPSISRPDKQRTAGDDLARNSVQEPDDLVTETLAWIHARQGNTHKAVRMYEKLKLRFPQKSDYFADLISKLKK